MSFALQATMFFSTILASFVSIASLANYVTADLRITAKHHSFGGVNYPSLQYLDPPYRDEVIRAIVKTNARVIRLFSEPSMSSKIHLTLTIP